MANPEFRRQVPESDPVYRAEREKTRTSAKTEAFGRNALSLYDMDTRAIERAEERIRETEQKLATGDIDEEIIPRTALEKHVAQDREFIEKRRADRRQYLRDDFSRLLQDIDYVSARAVSGAGQNLLRDRFANMLAAPGVPEELVNVFGEKLEDVSWNDFYFAVVEGRLSEGALYEMAKKNVESVQEQAKQLEELTARTKDEFRDAVKAAVAAGTLPASALNGLSRIDDVTVRLSDRLQSPRTAVLGTNDDGGRVTVSNEQMTPERMPRLRKTMMHEMLHEASGSSITVETKVVEGIGPVHRVYTRKKGLALKEQDSVRSPNRWLNEAVTERLALQLSGYATDEGEVAYNGSNSYPAERRELDRLIEAGLEESLVYEAYFEQFTSEQPKEERGKHYAALQKRVREIEGEDGVSKIDNAFSLDEIAATLDASFVYRIAPEAVDRSALPEGSKLYRVRTRYGSGPDSKVDQVFTFMARDYKIGDVTISAQEKVERVKGIVSYLSDLHKGRLTADIEEVP